MLKFKVVSENWQKTLEVTFLTCPVLHMVQVKKSYKDSAEYSSWDIADISVYVDGDQSG